MYLPKQVSYSHPLNGASDMRTIHASALNEAYAVMRRWEMRTLYASCTTSID